MDKFKKFFNLIPNIFEAAKMQQLMTAKYDLHQDKDGKIIFGAYYLSRETKPSEYFHKIAVVENETEINELKSELKKFNDFLNQFLQNKKSMI